MAEKWFQWDVYRANKLAQLQGTDPAYTEAMMEEAFIKAGFSWDADGGYDHFVQYGNAENVSPSEYFVVDEYLANKLAQLQADEATAAEWADKEPADVLQAIENANMTVWDHYIQYGTAEGINPSAAFDTAAYLQAKLDLLNEQEPEAGWDMPKLEQALVDAGMSALMHYEEYGIDEGVNYTPGGKPGEGEGGEGEGGGKPGEGEGGEGGEGEQPVPGTTFDLTTGLDPIVGTDGNDTIYGYEFDGNSTLQSGDRIDGGAGNDTLEADLAGQVNNVTPNVANVETILFRAQASHLNSGAHAVDAQRIKLDDGQMLTIGSKDSRVGLTIEDLRHNSNETAVRLQDADPGIGLNVYFNAKYIEANPAETTDTLALQMIDGRDAAATNQPLKASSYQGIKFELNGAEYELYFNADQSVFTSETEGTAAYTDLLNAIQTALQAEPLASLGLSAEFTGSFTQYDGITGTQVQGQTITISSSQGALTGLGWMQNALADPTNAMSATMATNTAESCPLTSTIVELSGAGQMDFAENGNCLPNLYQGSSAGVVTIGSMAQINGVERFDVKVDEASWVQTLQSTNNALRMVTVNGADIDGDGAAENGALYIGTWGGRGESWGDIAYESDGSNLSWTDAATLLTGGLNDVAVFDASSYAGDINIAATLTGVSYEKYMAGDDGSESQQNPPLEGYDGFAYKTGAGFDVVNFTTNSGIAADSDFNLTIDTGASDDLVAFRFDQFEHSLQEGDQKRLDNVQINTGADNDTVWFYGDNGGAVSINTGAGRDVIYANQQEYNIRTQVSEVAPDSYNAVFVFNTKYAEIGVSGARGATFMNNLGEGARSFAVSNPTDNETLYAKVTFKGFSAEAKLADVKATNMPAISALDVNKAIIEAIEDDFDLSNMLVARDGAEYGLLIESLINGQMAPADLTIEFISKKADGTAGTSGLVDGGWYATQFAVDENSVQYTGNNSTTSQVVVDGGANDDLIILGPNTVTGITPAGLTDIVLLSADMGNDSLVGFVTGQDKVSLAALLDADKALNTTAPASALENNAAVIVSGEVAKAASGIFSSAEINKLITDGDLKFDANVAGGSKAVVFLQENDANGNTVYTVVQLTSGATVVPNIVGTITMEAGTGLGAGDFTLADSLEDFVPELGPTTYDASSYEQLVIDPETELVATPYEDVFEDVNSTNLVNSDGTTALTLVDGGAATDTFNITGDIDTTTKLQGGAGDDVFNLAATTLSGKIDGGDGSGDTLNLNGAITTALIADDANFTNSGNIAGIENIVASDQVGALTLNLTNADAAVNYDAKLATAAQTITASKFGGDIELGTGTYADAITVQAGTTNLNITGFKAGGADTIRYSGVVGSATAVDLSTTDATIDPTTCNVAILFGDSDGLLSVNDITTSANQDAGVTGEVIIDSGTALVFVTDATSSTEDATYNIYEVTGGTTPAVKLVGSVEATSGLAGVDIVTA